jgi:hypothetical protein
MANLADAIRMEKLTLQQRPQITLQQRPQIEPNLNSASTITDAYRQYLGRDPEQAGLNYWQNAVSSGADISQVVSSIANSQEGQINNLYQTILGRNAESEGMGYWTAQLQAGAAISDIAAAMKESAEYKNSHATGLERVPFDGYQATLHEGEAVIDAQSVSAIRRYFGVTPAVYNRGADSSRTDALIAGLTAEVQRLQALVSDGNREARRTADAVNGSPEQPIPMELV